MRSGVVRMPVLHLASRPAEVARAVEAVRRFAMAEGLAPAAAEALALAVDEAFSNIIRHGSAASGAGAAEDAVRLQAMADGDGVTVELQDQGPPFDPRERAAPFLDGDAMERPVGGLGIHLMRSLVDDIAYARDGAWNRLTLRKAR
jgi:anti-sigma regulatory factor (Ser/Thr protein kinase)